MDVRQNILKFICINTLKQEFVNEVGVLLVWPKNSISLVWNFSRKRVFQILDFTNFQIWNFSKQVHHHEPYSEFSLKMAFNRHRRGLETCPQANLAKMSTQFSSLFSGPSDEDDSAPSREYTGQFVPFSPVSVNKLDKNFFSQLAIKNFSSGISRSIFSWLKFILGKELKVNSHAVGKGRLFF